MVLPHTAYIFLCLQSIILKQANVKGQPQRIPKINSVGFNHDGELSCKNKVKRSNHSGYILCKRFKQSDEQSEF